jgi:hypothetical protein
MALAGIDDHLEQPLTHPVGARTDVRGALFQRMSVRIGRPKRLMIH